jgi:5-methylcytosine-specific restriction endonuclease McrA
MYPETDNNILNSRVLVLNKLFNAVRIVTVRRAFVLLFKNSAEVIAKDNGTIASYDFPQWMELSGKIAGKNGHEFIRTITKKLRVPRVIRLMSYDKFPKQQGKASRKNILIRDDFTCQYCGKKYPAPKLSIDHIIPKSKKGASSWDNLVACCSKCNSKKGGRLPHEVGMKLIKKPAVPKLNHLFMSRLRDEKYSLWQEFISDKS